MKTASGIRRTSVSISSGNGNVISSGNGNGGGSSSLYSHDNGTNGNENGSSGIDSFLHRLDDDPDLKRMKQHRKTSNLDNDDDADSILHDNKQHNKSTTSSSSSSRSALLIKRIFLTIASLLILFLLYDTIASPPEKRLLGTKRIHDFLFWVKENPGTGAAAFVVVYGTCVALLLPGTPLTLGGGYVYKVAYGWAGGVAMATFTSMAGSLLGSCSCFVMGRYIMRDRVRRWGRKYPLFDAIDVAVSDNGFKIMCLLYLTPILPLGPVSYMCGTTSMALHKFAMAKIAALPLMLLYVFIGASTDTFFGSGDEDEGDADGGEASSVEGGAKKAGRTVHGVDEETHRKMVLFGLVLSIISMSLVSHFVKKELYKIFDKQKREKVDKEELTSKIPSSGNLNDEHVELIGGNDKLQRRPRGHHNIVDRSEIGLQDEEKG